MSHTRKMEYSAYTPYVPMNIHPIRHVNLNPFVATAP